jgi:hypothetical protein
MSRAAVSILKSCQSIFRHGQRLTHRRAEPSRVEPNRTILALVGAVLVAAAGLKLAGLAISPIPAVGPFSSPRLGVAVAAWELLLGAWLLSGQERILGWLAAVVTFLSFAAVSGYLGVIGVSSCGCFGAVKASPWAAFAVDIVALVVLLAIRPRCGWASQFRLPRRKLAWVAASVILFISLAGGTTAYYGSMDGGLAALRGERVSLSSSYLEFGEGVVGQELKASISITNFADTPLRIVGGTSDCSCTATENLPLTIPPGGTESVPITMKIPNIKPGQMTRKVILRTEDARHAEIRFRIGCLVR